MKRGRNIDFVETTMGLEMRSMTREEVDSSFGNGVFDDASASREVCFHIRIPPKRLQSPMDADADLGADANGPNATEWGGLGNVEDEILSAATRGIGRIVLEPMQEIQLRVFGGGGGVFSLVVRSFIPAAGGGKHGILWCAV